MTIAHKRALKSFALLLAALGAPAPTQAQDIDSMPDSLRNQVHVAFRSVDRDELMGGVSSVDMNDLNHKNYTTYTLDNMQAYVGGYTGSLWNVGDALVLVDGTPKDASSVLPSEVEQITFLKSAQAVVLYGSRAAKGVVLITTKRGHKDGLYARVTGNATVFVPKRYPKYLGSADYMQLYNEALVNDGKSPVYSDEDIYNYAAGTNRYRYPEINFFSSDYLKKTYQRYEGTAEISGGGKFAHFYTNIGLYHVGDLIKFGEGKNNHTNRFNVRTNLDMSITSWISAWVNASASFYNVRGDNSGFWAASATLRPTSQYPLTPLIPISAIEDDDEASQELIENATTIVDGKYLLGGTQSQQTNPFAAMYAAGYYKYTSRQLMFDAGVKLDLSSLAKGLSFTTRFSIDYSTNYTTSINNEYSTYEATWNNYSGTDLISSLTKYGTDKRTGTQNTSGSYYKQTILFNAQFDYDRQWGAHSLSGTLLANGYQQEITGEYHRVSNANLGLQCQYNWDHRYYADFSAALIHSAKLAPGHRNALSPVFTAAWRMSREKWLRDVKWIDDLKLTASVGVINQDIDISDYYLYDKVFTSTGTYWGWSESANTMQTSDSRRGANYNLGFVKRKEFRVGLDVSLWNRLINIDANFFNINMDGLVTTSSISYPNYYSTYYPSSSFLPYMNYNNQRRTGFDFTANIHKKVGQVDLQLGLTGMTYTSKNTKVSENVEYDWLKTEGKPIDALFGYKCLGFFQSEEEIANSAVINSNTKPGDLKYEDMNDDGVIDSKDAVMLGHWSASFYYGINLTAKYKGFTLFVNGTGSHGGKSFKNNSYYWCYGDGKYSDVVLGRWTEATASTATYPRLTTENSELDFVNSSFWLYSTSAFYLNKVQLTYDFKIPNVEDKFVKGLSVYVYGSDLLTIAKERKYMETNVGTTPQTRSYNLGVKVLF